ncbi:MAG: FkbM family methyltransferase [Ignavibacteriaceae bacterium]|nr:FkbM family methyltransferase [Ignavibacteriaceae bacterium]
MLENNISKIDFVKIDVEGNELNVLKGALNSIRAGMINMIQFEYNSFWQKSSSTLEAVFDLLRTEKFNFYRLTPWGKIPIKKYSKRIENYKQSNYLAVL